MGDSTADMNAAGVAAGAHLQLRPIACNTRLYSVPPRHVCTRGAQLLAAGWHGEEIEIIPQSSHLLLLPSAFWLAART